MICNSKTVDFAFYLKYFKWDQLHNNIDTLTVKNSVQSNLI